MSVFHLIYGIWVLLYVSSCTLVASPSCCPYQFFQQSNRRFEQKTDRFWKFSEQADRWVEVQLPCDLVGCSKVNTREESLDQEHEFDDKKTSLDNKDGELGVEEPFDVVLPLRKRISLTKMSDTSIWVTGESGSIYERFWNGLEWVIAPHDLPISSGRAIAVFIINQRIIALSEAGNLYQMHLQLGETSQSVWVEFTPTLNQITDNDSEKNPLILIKSGVVADDRQRAYFCTKNGTLIELDAVEPPRWTNHGQPAGANVAAIADVASTREVVYTISSAGDLYEYDRKSKPSWKRHIWQEKAAQVASLIPSKGCILVGLSGDHSESLFLLTKEGTLVERRLHQRKWKWVIHGSPRHQTLSSITPALQDDSSETSISLFFTTSAGSVFEYQMPKQLGTVPNNQFPGTWGSHQNPLHAKAARGISGLPLQAGRILFALDDDRLAELHLVGLGGENTGPALSQNFRRKASTKYVWSILDVPESEGWNAEYCTEERGPRNCMIGTKDESKDSGISSVTGRRKQSQAQNYYLSLGKGGDLVKASEDHNLPDDWISSNFRLRLMYEGKAFFLITTDGLVFEYICIEGVWVWLKHDSSTTMNGIMGNYNGSLFMVDTFGSLLLRELSDNQITWRNCTSMRKGRNIIGGQPWDRLPGIARRVTSEDSLFFVSKNGRLLQFMVFMRKFKWKDCKSPPNVKVACIVDQELFRENIVFIIGRNGRLYQYNKVTDLWHEHYQSQHLILSQFPGTIIRPSPQSLSGSLFMLSTEGGLVEYHWNTWYGWNWVEHGTPYKGVTLVGSPGPSFEGNQLLLIGSDGKVYLRYMDNNAWKWKDCGFPSMGNKMVDAHRQGRLNGEKEAWIDEDSVTGLKKDQENFKCDPKVASTRPIQFSEGSVIFELRDSRVFMRKFKWKDCKSPPNVKVACIVDQELFRENIVFIIGRNGRLYQYNKVTDLWHEHYQSQHLILSQFPGTIIRPSPQSLSGSLFMLSTEGGLVEYHWNTWYGWNWVEHGTPYKGVTLVGSPGPSFEGNQLLLIGSDGKVYLRYMDNNAWKWKDCGFPSMGNKMVDAHRQGRLNGEKEAWIDEDSVTGLKKDQENFKCDPKVASTRPIQFSEGSVIFELRDSRLAEIQLVEEKKWAWSEIIGTPASSCLQNYWITVSSS
ncbi:uncharacterized protein LOC133303696 isoform X2 [Gastrolobium bilobum]|uniref:uncharacterized protein LOC133303696 isoform X2 n=1 Tax=Gastrolobium bilobum TaxID=150636 RepID=UPI002AB27E26|nr:uncharacterized protein LOC133303696 isoform X2 [Gastrolobium bilobum]